MDSPYYDGECLGWESDEYVIVSCDTFKETQVIHLSCLIPDPDQAYCIAVDGKCRLVLKYQWSYEAWSSCRHDGKSSLQFCAPSVVYSYLIGVAVGLPHAASLSCHWQLWELVLV